MSERVKQINCLQCVQQDSCCQEGVWVDLEQAREISALKLTGEFHHLEQDQQFPSGYKVSSSHNDRPCSFLTKDGLCTIHLVDYELKPFYCKEFPYEDGELSAHVKEICLPFKPR